MFGVARGQQGRATVRQFRAAHEFAACLHALAVVCRVSAL